MTRAILATVMVVTLLAMGVPALGVMGENAATSEGPLTEGQGIANATVVESDASSTIIDIQVPSLQKEEITVNGDTFQVLTISDYAYTEEVGKPQIPVIREIVGK